MLMIVCLFLLLIYQPDVKVTLITKYEPQSPNQAIYYNSVRDSHDEIVAAYYEKRKVCLFFYLFTYLYFFYNFLRFYTSKGNGSFIR